MKVTPGSQAAGHGHSSKGGGFIPPLGNNTPPKEVVPNMSERITHSTPRNGIGPPDPDDFPLSIQASIVFCAIDDGKRPKQVNSLKKDQDDQYQSRSFGSTRDNHPDQISEPDQRYWPNTTED